MFNQGGCHKAAPFLCPSYILFMERKKYGSIKITVAFSATMLFLRDRCLHRSYFSSYEIGLICFRCAETQKIKLILHTFYETKNINSTISFSFNTSFQIQKPCRETGGVFCCTETFLPTVFLHTLAEKGGL